MAYCPARQWGHWRPSENGTQGLQALWAVGLGWRERVCPVGPLSALGVEIEAVCLAGRRLVGTAVVTMAS